MKFQEVLNYLIVLQTFVLKISCEEDKIAENEKQIEIFRRLFAAKRREHSEAVKLLTTFEIEKQKFAVTKLHSQIVEIIEKCKTKMERENYDTGMDFPTDVKLREALTMLLENSAFLSDIVLHLPSIFHVVRTEQESYKNAHSFGLTFASKCSFLDPETKKIVDLALQETGIVEKSPDYVNPFVKNVEPSLPPPPKQKPSKPRKKVKKGPRMSGQFDEL